MIIQLVTKTQGHCPSPHWLRAAPGVITPLNFQAALTLEKSLRQRSKESLKLSSIASGEITGRPKHVMWWDEGTPKHLFHWLYYSVRATEQKDDEMNIKWKAVRIRTREGWSKKEKDGRTGTWRRWNKERKESEAKWEGAVRNPGKAQFTWLGGQFQ